MTSEFMHLFVPDIAASLLLGIPSSFAGGSIWKWSGQIVCSKEVGWQRKVINVIQYSVNSPSPFVAQ
jgi:hypothetical protein